MAWEDPSDEKDRDPWNGRRRRSDGPPDLDEVMRRAGSAVRGLFGKSGGSGGRRGSGNSSRNNPLKRILGYGGLVAVLGWAALGLYQVDQQERGVVLRLGAFLEVVDPGLHWNPWLIDKVSKINVTRINSIGHRALMLTEDENIVDVNISVQYLVNNPKDFLLKVKNPVSSLRQAAESALRHVVGSTKMDQILTNSDATRERIALEVQERLQTYMNNYSTGMRIEEVNIEEPQPPQAVKAAFDDVLKALEDETRVKNEAETYAKGIVPEARGMAARLLKEAEAYKDQVIARSSGEADRFNKLLVEYRKAPEVTRERLYLDTVQSVLSRSTKIVLDIEKGNNLTYLPLDRIIQRAEQSSSSASPTGSAQWEEERRVNRLADRVQEELNKRRNTPRRDVR